MEESKASRSRGFHRQGVLALVVLGQKLIGGQLTPSADRSGRSKMG